MSSSVTVFILLAVVSEARHEATSMGPVLNDEANISVAFKKMNRDAVVEKFVETLIASEKYLRLVEQVDRKLIHLEQSFHSQSSIINKYLADLLKNSRSSSGVHLEQALRMLREELESTKKYAKFRINEGVHGFDSKLEGRLIEMDSNLKGVLLGTEKIHSLINQIPYCQQRSSSRSSDTIAAVGSGSNCADTYTIVSDLRKSISEIGNKKCECSKMGRFDRSERYPTDCYEIQMQGFNVSGIYKIKPDDMDSFYVLCDLSTAGGGWTVLQNRFDGSQDFFKKWWDYKHGFGNLAGEFWLGLEKMHYVTNQKLYELRIELETQRGHDAYAGYSVFTIGPEYEGYRISTLGTFYGNAGDSLTYHAGQKFSTPDVDNDDWKEGACATEHGGAWWYKECDKSNLNGKYSLPTEESSPTQSIYWISFEGPNYPLAKTKMMIRPLPASRPLDYHVEAPVKIKKIESNPKALEKVDRKPKLDARLMQRYKYNPQNTEPFFTRYP